MSDGQSEVCEAIETENELRRELREIDSEVVHEADPFIRARMLKRRGEILQWLRGN